jgi:catechol 2,3-dioxygenase-like lactoylglutathione lyase family enzyme
MKRSALLFTILLCCAVAASSDSPKRPRILGIAYVRILVTNVDKAKDFYSLALHSIPPSNDPDAPCTWCERAPTSLKVTKKRLGPIELEAVEGQPPSSLLREVAFSTDDAKKLRNFLLKNGVRAEKLTKCGEDPCFAALDPEQQRLIFVQRSGTSNTEIPGAYSPAPTRSPIIHAGFVVHDRAVEDRFYKDILGFHVYWHGGRTDDETSWVDMQVPDGTDWLEYMLNVSPDASHKTLGVMNHIALGVPDIHAVEQKLRTNGWTGTEQPKIGRDGKWQLNLYDPDDTRVEFMEFTPVQKPCCSDYTGPHPKP